MPSVRYEGLNENSLRCDPERNHRFTPSAACCPLAFCCFDCCAEAACWASCVAAPAGAAAAAEGGALLGGAEAVGREGSGAFSGMTGCTPLMNSQCGIRPDSMGGRGSGASTSCRVGAFIDSHGCIPVHGCIICMGITVLICCTRMAVCGRSQRDALIHSHGCMVACALLYLHGSA